LDGVTRENACQVRGQILLLGALVAEARDKVLQSQVRSDLQEENLDENTRTCRGGLLGKRDSFQASPRDRVCVHEVGEEAGKVAELALLETVDALVLAGEKLAEFLPVDVEELAEALADIAVEWQVRPVLRAALDDHIA